ncbi:hypothetical protein BDV24DRAFT_161566 [Aspergillus arachidicola]|uniref:Tat pathway signal sequence n=1 Tax=Aspergillus arachidicola TaxID=656916 RepID=A0A5N6YF75_9EURO|nr:hypothetical protein BDV24DRAFT_161566 [Aspergillus arachidicola]
MIDQDEISERESDSLLKPSNLPWPKDHRYTGTTRFLIALSISLNIFWVGLGSVYWISNISTRKNYSSYENGFASDLEAVKHEIELIQYDFNGGVKLDEHGNYFTDHGGHEYVGSPTPEIDRAWDLLLSGLNIDLKGSDANLDGRTIQWPDSDRYFTGLEVFHSLHCLNRLRQAMYPNYYDVFSHPDDPSREDHIGYSVPADLTPMEWILVDRKIILNTATHHTCRNFDKIHEWARQRHTNFQDVEAVWNGSLFIVD